jgi:hypothetical protein
MVGYAAADFCSVPTTLLIQVANSSGLSVWSKRSLSGGIDWIGDDGAKDAAFRRITGVDDAGRMM